jgi:hypothetical protein
MTTALLAGGVHVAGAAAGAHDFRNGLPRHRRLATPAAKVNKAQLERAVGR